MWVDRLPWYRLIGSISIAVGLNLSYGADSAPARNPESILQGIGDKVAAHLSLLPNYTCHEVINRIVRWPNPSGQSQHDRVELEVAFVGQRELFGRVGDSHIEEQRITNLVTSGTIGSGLFGNYAVAIFLGNIASFDYMGIFKVDGHKVYRYDFQVPLEKTNFWVRHNDAEAKVSYQGSAWADFDTFDLVRLEITTDQIPAHIGIGSVRERADYTPVRFRSSEFMLPLHAEMEISDRSGNLNSNQVSLEQCREFKGESTLQFGGPLDSPSTDRKSLEK